jgi:hypothetical protein
MDAESTRVLRLFGLTLPPVFVLLLCYTCLGEHVFGLAYVIGKRLKPRAIAMLRATYFLSTGIVAASLHLALLFSCGNGAGLSACPLVRVKERGCLISTSVTAVYCGATLLLERWANPMLDLGRPVGWFARTCDAVGIALTWSCIADHQLCAQLLLLLFTSRRALARVSGLAHLHGLLIKGYTVIHMSRILTGACAGIPRLAVATVGAMVLL